MTRGHGYGSQTKKLMSLFITNSSEKGLLEKFLSGSINLEIGTRVEIPIFDRPTIAIIQER